MKKSFTLPLLTAFALSAVSSIMAADFHDHLGLQMWSLRAQTKDSTPAALDQVKAYGITEVETAGTGNLTAEQFAVELKSRGLHAVSAHIAYDILNKDIDAAIATAKTLGASWIVCPYPKTNKEKKVDDATIHEMAMNFNKWGQACKAAGLHFGYHPHGLEFIPSAANPSEKLFDVLLRETTPGVVSYEMDVFWAYHAGEDPAKLLLAHPDRWTMLHVKDMRNGAPHHFSTGSAPAADNVAVGSGQIDWPAVLGAAKKIGVQYYFIEDETPAPLENIPASLAYLRKLKL